MKVVSRPRPRESLFYRNLRYLYASIRARCSMLVRQCLVNVNKSQYVVNSLLAIDSCRHDKTL